MNVFALSKIIKGGKKASARITIYIQCLYFTLLDSWWEEFRSFNIFHRCFCYFLDHLEIDQLCVVICILRLYPSTLYPSNYFIILHLLECSILHRWYSLVFCCLAFLFQTKRSISNANKISIIPSPWLCVCECKKAYPLLFLLGTHSCSAWKRVFWGVSPRHSVK